MLYYVDAAIFYIHVSETTRSQFGNFANCSAAVGRLRIVDVEKSGEVAAVSDSRVGFGWDSKAACLVRRKSLVVRR
jgi:hypothetical protein